MLTPLNPQFGVRVQNDSGLDIPPYSIVVCTFVDNSPVAAYDPNYQYATQDTHHVMPFACQKGTILVTGPAVIPGVINNSNGIGTAYIDQLQYVAMDELVADPQPGDEWGPIPGQWQIGPKGVGFLYHGRSNTDIGIKTGMFLRTYARASSIELCASSSSSSSSGGSGSSGSRTSTSDCGCVDVVVGVSCTELGLSVSYGQARACC